jgi:predicted transcriptional regulator
MLNRLETTVMEYLFSRCRGKRTVLIAPQEILDNIAPKYEITRKQLETHMKNLVLDGYVDFSNSDDKGNMYYVVTLSTRGEAFQRERDERVTRRWKDIGWKVVLTAIAFAVSYVLWSIVGR